MAKEAVVNARAAIAAVMIVLIFVMDVSVGWAERGSLRDDPPLEALAAMRCDEDHANWRDRPIGMTGGVSYLPHAWRDDLLNLAWPDSQRYS
jgi:hypothetical protein